MAKKSFEIGVHPQHSFSPKGVSVAGHDAKVEAGIKAQGRPDPLGYLGSAKHQHKKVLAELKSMPKPNLTKDEDMVEITEDGKQEIVEGKEPLKKDPKKIKDKWASLKKGLNNLNSIMDLAAASENDQDQDQDPSNEENEEPTQEDEFDSEENVDQDVDQDDEDDAAAQDDEYIDGDLGDEEENADDQGSEQQIIQALKDEGYSEPEIAYIVHGHHSPTYDESKEAKAHATYAMADVDTDNARQEGKLRLDQQKQIADLEHQHAMRMKDLEFQHAQMQSPDPETEKNHKKRMLDLEYEGAKMQMPDGSDKEHAKRMQELEYQNAVAQAPSPEVSKKMQEMDIKERELQLKLKEEQIKLELEFKKKEHELKMKMMEENMKQQAKQKNQISSEKHKQKLADTKNPSKKPLKKSFDVETGEIDDE